MNRALKLGLSVAALAGLAACGGARATYAAPTMGPPVPTESEISEAELDPRLSHEDGVAVARWDRYANPPSPAATEVTVAEPQAAGAAIGATTASASPPAPVERSAPTSYRSESDAASDDAERCSCDAADQYRDQICELSRRICGIADAHPEFEDIRTRCTDSTARCASATERARSCDC